MSCPEDAAASSTSRFARPPCTSTRSTPPRARLPDPAQDPPRGPERHADVRRSHPGFTRPSSSSVRRVSLVADHQGPDRERVTCSGVSNGCPAGTIWGSVGLVAMEGRQTVASVQFAPVRAFSDRTRCPRSPAGEAVLVFCLRGRVGRPVNEARQFLTGPWATCADRSGALCLRAACRQQHLCGVRNLFGRSSSRANGFQVVRSEGDTR